ncbi:MAG: ClpXP protease specificity-enhancing factor SspB [Holosporaceae bacterium]|jgi:hypothetical protein|nr:ClpXP protease specificity-enhancing factor SspB [Holosporaceae bacterium]
MSHFRYDDLVQKALIAVVREVLEDVSANGIIGSHHFYVRFRTDHPRTKVPDYLKERHPEEVMIILQYQFWNLKVFSDYFSVDLSFSGVRETLVIPFSSLTAFVDPSVKFALQFTPSLDRSDSPNGEHSKTEKNTDSDVSSGNGDGKIISFDSFRKK